MRTLTHLVEYGRRRPAARPTARRNSPSAAPPVAFPRKNSPSTAQKRRIWGVLSALGELFRAYTTKHRRRATNIAHSMQKHGDIETNNTTAHPQQGTTKTAITSAPKKCTKNAHFPPAKAMAVSIPHRHQQAKATMVSNHRATWPTGPGRSAGGPFRAHVNPMTCAWAVPPTLRIAGLRAILRVTAHHSGFTCEQHTTTDADSAKP